MELRLPRISYPRPPGYRRSIAYYDMVQRRRREMAYHSLIGTGTRHRKVTQAIRVWRLDYPYSTCLAFRVMVGFAERSLRR